MACVRAQQRGVMRRVLASLHANLAARAMAGAELIQNISGGLLRSSVVLLRSSIFLVIVNSALAPASRHKSRPRAPPRPPRGPRHGRCSAAELIQKHLCGGELYYTAGSS